MYTVDASLIERFGLHAAQFAGRTALITGAARGLGEATARTLAALGAQIVIVDVRTDDGNAVVQDIREAGGEAAFLHCDLGDGAAVRGGVRRSISQDVTNRIHCTATVRDRLADKFRFEPRGEIEIKGKGPMTTYFLLGATDQVAP